MDQEIENLTKQCQGCYQQRNNPQSAPLHHWEWPSTPWYLIHVDYAGPFQGHMFLVIVDSHSKWPEVVCTNLTTSAQTIEILQTIFARNGIPVQMVSDNVPQFKSEEFSHEAEWNFTFNFSSLPSCNKWPG